VTGDETIMLVEDEGAVRALTTRILERLGYRVEAAANGDDALVVLEDAGRSIDLLLTDVILPGSMQGNELARVARLLRPDLAVLYMSGYARDTIVHDGRLDEGVNYLPKPFTPNGLARRVREVLDRKDVVG
jgi:CheY-like chemotaxis protein